METKHNIDVPAEFVFEQLVDYAEFEAMLLGHGAFVERLDDLDGVGEGMKWLIAGNLKGKERTAQVEIAEFVDQEQITYLSQSKEVDAKVCLTVLPLAANETRLSVKIEPSANTISARLILQSAKLARKSLQRRLDKRMAAYAESIEDKYMHGTSV